MDLEEGKKIQLLSVTLEKYNVTVQKLKLGLKLGCVAFRQNPELLLYACPVPEGKKRGIWSTEESHPLECYVFISSVWERENQEKKREGTGQKGLSDTHLENHFSVWVCTKKTPRTPASESALHQTSACRSLAPRQFKWGRVQCWLTTTVLTNFCWEGQTQRTQRAQGNAAFRYGDAVIRILSASPIIPTSCSSLE